MRRRSDAADSAQAPRAGAVRRRSGSVPTGADTPRTRTPSAWRHATASQAGLGPAAPERLCAESRPLEVLGVTWGHTATPRQRCAAGRGQRRCVRAAAEGCQPARSTAGEGHYRPRPASPLPGSLLDARATPQQCSPEPPASPRPVNCPSAASAPHAASAADSSRCGSPVPSAP